MQEARLHEYWSTRASFYSKDDCVLDNIFHLSVIVLELSYLCYVTVKRVFMLCDCKTGFSLDFIIHTGVELVYET